MFTYIYMQYYMYTLKHIYICIYILVINILYIYTDVKAHDFCFPVVPSVGGTQAMIQMLAHGFRSVTGSSLAIFKPEKVLIPVGPLELRPGNLDDRAMFRAEPLLNLLMLGDVTLGNARLIVDQVYCYLFPCNRKYEITHAWNSKEVAVAMTSNLGLDT